MHRTNFVMTSLDDGGLVQAQETGIFFVVGGAVAAAERNFLGMQAFWPPAPALHSLSLSQHLLVNETKHGLRPSAQVLAYGRVGGDARQGGMWTREALRWPT